MNTIVIDINIVLLIPHTSFIHSMIINTFSDKTPYILHTCRLQQQKINHTVTIRKLDKR